MSRILFITNMEHHDIGMKSAQIFAEAKSQLSNFFVQEYINDSEIWNKRWEEKIRVCDFVLISWMGTDCVVIF